MNHLLSDHADPETIARSESGRQALETLNIYGIEVATEITLGRFSALVLAYAALTDWTEARRVFDELHDTYEPPRRSKPVLVVDNR